jgi:hypothetical protein
MLQSDFIGADSLGSVIRNSSCLDRLGPWILERRGEERRERERLLNAIYVFGTNNFFI